MRIGLVLHPRRDCSAAVRPVAAWTTSHGVELVASPDDVRRLAVDGVVPVPVAELASTCDGLLALGGDGTILGAMRLVADRPVPVLGVNLGRLGFLAEVEVFEVDAALTALTEGRSTTEDRGCLVVRCDDGVEHLAFNDAVLARVPGEGLVDATMAVDGRPHGHYRCDALVVATPMGSSAYSYAAGGPVVSPSVDAVLVTPSAPMNGIAHSIVLGPAEALRLQITGGRPALELDGLVTGRLDVGAGLEIAFRPDAGRLVRIDGSRSADRSRVKLSLLDLPYLPEELLELAPADVRDRLSRKHGDGRGTEEG